MFRILHMKKKSGVSARVAKQSLIEEAQDKLYLF